MKKIGIIIFVLALAIGLAISSLFSFGRSTASLFNVSFDIGSVKGSGKTATAMRDLKDFSAVNVGGVFVVEITAADNFEVELEADDNLLPFISTEVVNGTLRLETEKRLKTDNPIRVRISAPSINDLDVSGASKVTFNNVSGGTIKVDASGASHVKLAGDAADLNLDVSGASRIDASKLTATSANVDASGASHIDLNVTQRLNAEASGASTVAFSGSPASVVKDVSGAGSVTAR